MGCLSAICLVLGSYSESTHPYFPESTHHPAEKRAASDLNVLEQLEMPEMVFAGSREAQGSQTRSSKIAKKQLKNVGSRDQNGRGVNYEFITIATFKKIQEKYNFCFGIICNKFHIFSIFYGIKYIDGAGKTRLRRGRRHGAWNQFSGMELDFQSAENW